jgi:hypothetical protein
MNRQKTARHGVCTFCGHRRLLTKDHIPPKCLFGSKGNLPSDLITVPACEDCNLKTSGDDEFLRLNLAPMLEASGHPVARSLVPTIARSLGRPEAIGFAKSFLQNVTLVRTFTYSGIYVGKMPAMRIDHVRLMRIVEKIVRGLFVTEYGKRLPQSSVVLSIFTNVFQRHIRGDEFEVWRHQVRELLAGGYEREVGRRTLIYRCNRHPKRVFWSVWALTFYGNLHFVAFTNTPLQLRKAEQVG